MYPCRKDLNSFTGGSLQVTPFKQAELPYVMQKVFGEKH
jgi:hypothetical protein